ncbi:MAG TPA: hypothetical protein VNE67_09210 [Acetobacteraceae bacterium]|nr:hypothetical protein [Acetobacteraceae bacterium]
MSATLSCRPLSPDYAAIPGSSPGTEAGFGRPPRPPGAPPVTTAPAPRRTPRAEQPDARTAAT